MTRFEFTKVFTLNRSTKDMFCNSKVLTLWLVSVVGIIGELSCDTFDGDHQDFRGHYGHHHARDHGGNGAPRFMKSNAVVGSNSNFTFLNLFTRNVSTSSSENFKRYLETYREKRSPPMTSSEILKILNKHNELRRREGASNMQILKWNSYLANMADEWSQGCQWKHGQPYRDPNTLPYKQLGQNLYTITGGTLDIAKATQDWYDEKQYYNYGTLECVSGQQCGHYTQVVWFASREVGCASSFCPTLSGSGFTKAFYLVCNYGPPGNYVGEKIYKKGPACTRCQNPSGAGWCNDGLCNSDCLKAGSTCSCSTVCKNCGNLNSDTCICSCAKGWYGQDCSEVCRDKDKDCNGNPGWPPSWCNHAQFGAQVKQSCPAMCKLCQVGPPDSVCSSASPMASKSTNKRFLTIYQLFIFGSIFWFLRTASSNFHD